LVVEVDGVLDDVPFGIEIGKDVDGRVRHEQGVCIGRYVHHEHMADAPIGSQAAHLRRDGAHQLIGVQTALHQHLAFGGVDQLDALGGCFLAMRGIDNLEAGDVETVLGGRIHDLPFRPDEDRPDDAGLCTLDSAAQ
jgi:hypothetical protein